MPTRWCFASFLVAVSLCCIAQEKPATKSAVNPQEVQNVSPLGTPVGPDYSKMSPDELEGLGDDARARKDYLTALDCFQAALPKTSTPAIIYNKIGMTYIGMNQWQKAKPPLQKAIKLDKNYPEAHNNLGVAIYSKAVEDTRRVRAKGKTLDPKDTQPRLGGAVKEYRKAIELSPESASFHSNLGTAYFQQKDYDRGLSEYREAFRLDPLVFERSAATGVSAHMNGPGDRARYYFTLARLHAATGDNDRALQALRRALEDGFGDVKEIYKAPEFAKLVKDDRFTEMMKQRPTAIPSQY